MIRKLDPLALSVCQSVFNKTITSAKFIYQPHTLSRSRSFKRAGLAHVVFALTGPDISLFCPAQFPVRKTADFWPKPLVMAQKSEHRIQILPLESAIFPCYGNISAETSSLMTASTTIQFFFFLSLVSLHGICPRLRGFSSRTVAL